MKKFLIVIALSLLLSCGAAVSIYFGFKAEFYEPSVLEQISAYFLLPLWAFSAVPAYVYTVENIKSFAHGFWLGYVFGLFFPLLIAPVLAVIYIVGTIEKLIKK